MELAPPAVPSAAANLTAFENGVLSIGTLTGDFPILDLFHAAAMAIGM